MITENEIICCGQDLHRSTGFAALVIITIIAAFSGVCSSANDSACVSLPVAPSNKTTTGQDLWCYECRETYVKKYNIVLSPCLNNLSLITVRQCSQLDEYCKVERTDLNRNVMSIERSCSGSCPYGCKFSGWGLTNRRCTSCCRTNACNDDNGGHVTTVSLTSYLLREFVLIYIASRGL